MFHKHERRRQLLNWNEYRGDFDDFVYDDGINMNLYSPSIYDIYFDGDYIDNNIINNDNNGSDDIINVVIFK
jgi:hypothetical protein